MRRAVGRQASIGDDGDRRRKVARLVRIMGREHDGVALGAQRPHPLEHQQAIAEIEAGGRLVHHQQGRILGERAGDQAELALAAGDAVGLGRGKLGDAEIGQRRLRPLMVARSGRGERPEMRRASHQHQVEDGIGELHDLRLRDVGHRLRQLAARERVDGPAVDRDLAGERPGSGPARS